MEGNLSLSPWKGQLLGIEGELVDACILLAGPKASTDSTCSAGDVIDSPTWRTMSNESGESQNTTTETTDRPCNLHRNSRCSGLCEPATSTSNPENLASSDVEHVSIRTEDVAVRSPHPETTQADLGASEMSLCDTETQSLAINSWGMLGPVANGLLSGTS